jgi:multidrug efflux pump subunit AcrA (membrane-fusion protein)
LAYFVLDCQPERDILLTGAFANVRLELPNPEAAIHVPASALIFDQKGLRVATVSADDRIVLKQVTISRDLGREVEIGSGLTAQGRIVESPSDGIGEGDQVRIAGKPGAGNAAENAAQRRRKL